MTMYLFIGDMLVMAFMVGVAIWASQKTNDAQIAATARIPLEDEDYNG